MKTVKYTGTLKSTKELIESYTTKSIKKENALFALEFGGRKIEVVQLDDGSFEMEGYPSAELLTEDFTKLTKVFDMPELPFFFTHVLDNHNMPYKVTKHDDGDGVLVTWGSPIGSLKYPMDEVLACVSEGYWVPCEAPEPEVDNVTEARRLLGELFLATMAGMGRAHTCDHIEKINTLLNEEQVKQGTKVVWKKEQ